MYECRDNSGYVKMLIGKKYDQLVILCDWAKQITILYSSFTELSKNNPIIWGCFLAV